MNLRDVVVIVGVLLIGLAVGYVLGRNSVAVPAPVAASAPVAPAAAVAQAAAPEPPAALAAAGVPSEVAPAPQRVERQPEFAGEENIAAEVKARLPGTAFALNGAPIVGDPNKAKVAVVAFSDFECPFCAEAVPTLSSLRQRYGDDLLVAFRHLPLDLHERAIPAALAAWAAQQQGKFWEYHDTLFANQKSLDDASLKRFAQKVGLDVEQWDRDRRSTEARIALEVDKQMAARMEITGTPTFLINGSKLIGALPVETFANTINSNMSRVATEMGRGKTLMQARGEVTEVNAMRNLDPEGVSDLRALRPVPIDDRPGKGTHDPLVAIVVFSDFECPHCAKVDEPLMRLMEEYPTDVRVVFRHNPLSFHTHAKLAAQASLAAANQGKFWEYHDVLFQNQDALTRPDLLRYARELGLEMTQFEEALNSGMFEEAINHDQKMANALTLDGTPSVLINGRMITGARPYEQVRKVFLAAKLQAEEMIVKGEIERENFYASLQKRLSQ